MKKRRDSSRNYSEVNVTSLLDRLLGRRKGAEVSSASLAKKRLSIIVASEGGYSEFSRELEERIKRCVFDFYVEKGFTESVAFEEISHELHGDDGILEVSIPLPEASR